jgi:hypothetical protein
VEKLGRPEAEGAPPVKIATVGGVTVGSQWGCSGVTIVSQWRYSVSVVSEWCDSGVTANSPKCLALSSIQWGYSSVTMVWK